jgi:limonene 1,2-monooxygenase
VHVLGRPDAVHVDDPDALVAQVAGNGAAGAGAAVVGTPDEMIAAIRNLREITGGFGTVLGFAHDWANREATLRSWELFARFVVPELNGYTRNQQGSADFIHDRKEELVKGAGAAIMAKIQGDPRAAAAFAVTMQQAKEAAERRQRANDIDSADA